MQNMILVGAGIVFNDKTASVRLNGVKVHGAKPLSQPRAHAKVFLAREAKIIIRD